MIDRPYEILNCSWPRPVSEVGRRWVSEPEWDAPPTHVRPEPQWKTVDVLMFGEHQWPDETRAMFDRALPFTRVVPTDDVLATVRSRGGPELAEMAKLYWFVMKSCIGLLYAPHEFCLMDDDIVVLGSVSDGLAAFRESEFAFAPDLEHEALYVSIWGSIFGGSTLSDTAAVNTGLYWPRNPFDPEYVAQRMLAGAHRVSAQWAWEQGLFAHLFHNRSITRLPSQRYFYPLLDGLPGGIEGYDYACNPCGFATIHFGGPIHKPGDETMLPLFTQILNRGTK